MTATNWLSRLVCSLLALCLLVGSLVAIVEIVAAGLGHAPVLVPFPDWTSWLRAHSWNDWIVNAALGGLVVLGLLLLILGIHRGKPASLALTSGSEGVRVTASRRSVEKTLAAAAARTPGIADASASVGRRTARVKGWTLAPPEPGTLEDVESAVSVRLESLGLARRMGTQVDLSTKDTR